MGPALWLRRGLDCSMASVGRVLRGKCSIGYRRSCV